jgi:hypothetical protein
LEERIMTNFVHVDTPPTHPGVVRAEAVIERLRRSGRDFDSSRGLAAFLLAAIVSSLLVVADKLMSTTEEGGLLVAWVVLWGVAFVGLALFAGTARSLAVRAIAATREAVRLRAAARADEEFMAYAKHDPRILRDLQVAASRQEAAQVAAAGHSEDGVPSFRNALRSIGYY